MFQLKASTNIFSKRERRPTMFSAGPCTALIRYSEACAYGAYFNAN